MSVGLPPLGGLDRAPTRPVAPPDRTPQAPVEEFRPAPRSADPPPELLAETQVAQRVVDDLRASGRELRFDVDEETGRIRCEVRDLDGNVVRRVPLDEMLDIASGGKLRH